MNVNQNERQEFALRYASDDTAGADRLVMTRPSMET